MDTISMETLLAEPPDVACKSRSGKSLARADVIIAVDLGSQHEFTVFGTPALEDTVRIGTEQALRTVRVMLNQDAGELDKLLELVKTIKGLRGGSPRDA